MENDYCKRFLGCVEKVDGKDIVLKHKSGGIYNREIFYNWKKRYALDFFIFVI